VCTAECVNGVVNQIAGHGTWSFDSGCSVIIVSFPLQRAPGVLWLEAVRIFSWRVPWWAVQGV
jgi:hypothetical protein